ncbi:Regulator of chromosome condensation [Chytriomyces hyalinus]|nr:Regulator of chromosome condensation [Chytriomyces hyalinus]
MKRLDKPKPVEGPQDASMQISFEVLADLDDASCYDDLLQPCREQENERAAVHSIGNDQKSIHSLQRVLLSSTQQTLTSSSKPAVSPAACAITADYARVRSIPNKAYLKLEAVPSTKPICSTSLQDRGISQHLKEAKTDNGTLQMVGSRAHDAVDRFEYGFQILKSEHSDLSNRLSRVEDVVRRMRAVVADAKALASKPRLAVALNAKDGDNDMPQAMLQYMNYFQAARANPSLITSTELPAAEIGKASQHPADLFSVGQNDDGQMGLFNNEYEGGIPCSSAMKAVKLPVCSSLVKLVSGGMHTVALTSTGELLSWGAADFIGRIDSSKNWQAQFVPFDAKIVDAVCGECFTAVLDNSGHIWAWGSFRNTEGKELFSTETSRQRTPIKLAGRAGQAFVATAAGESHLLALSSRGTHADDHETRIYACGGNGYGELGMGDFQIKWHLSEVESMRGQEVDDIKGGLHHTVLLKKDGSVWVSGRGHNGQLGLGEVVEHVQAFTRLHVPAKVSSVTCSTSGSQTYLISDQGELFSCGYNCYGQLALKMDEDAVYTPHQVPLKGRQAILVSAGCQFAVLCASGK